MKKAVLFVILILAAAVGPVMAQAEELAGSWISFFGDNFTLLRFSPGGSELRIIRSNGFDPEIETGTWRVNGDMLIYKLEGYSSEDELPYSFEDGKLHMPWFISEEGAIRIDDQYFPEDIENSPFLGEDKDYWIAQQEDGTIQIIGYVGHEESVTVPDTVFGFPITVIGADSFSGIEGLKHVTLPEGITRINGAAFANNDELESVEIPQTVRKIGTSAFENCPALKEITIPEGVLELDADTFWGCSSLTSVTLPGSLEMIEDGAFQYPDQIRFTVPQGSYAERYCRENNLDYTALAGDGTVSQPETAEPSDPRLTGTWLSFYTDEKDYFAFLRFAPDGRRLTILDCRAFNYEVYSGTWKSDGETLSFTEFGNDYADEMPYTFDGEKMTLEWYGDMEFFRIDDSWYPEDPAASPYIGEEKVYWFNMLPDQTIRISGVLKAEETMEIPGTVFGIPVSTIGWGAFQSARGVKHVVLPEGITTLETQAFDSADDLESIVLPASLESIGYAAFSGCSSLKEIVIPEGIKTIEGYTFFSCDSLEKIVVPGSVELIDWPNFNNKETIFITQPGSYAEEYCLENDLVFVHSEEELEELKNAPVTYGDGYNNDEPEYGYEEEGNAALYEKAMALYNEEKYYSAREAFLMSGYGDWEEMADKCIQDWPATGEIWHDRSQWLQDMVLTITVEQPRDTAMLIRVYKNDAPISYLFIAGSDSVTVRLPGNGYYSIRDGIGYDWYGVKEAFGRDGRYEAMTFDDAGTEQVYLQSYYEYTLSINVSSPTPGGDDVYSEAVDWDKFAVTE